MATSNIKASIPCDIHSVWKVVTEVENYTWRSDLSKTEVISDKRFIEYTKEGYPTTFTITITEPYKRWEFDMENSNMKGHWVGLFISKDNETEIDFTEYVTAKKFFMKYLGAKSNDGYHNRKTGFCSYFLTFEDGARIEIMNIPEMADLPKKLARTGYSHIAFSVGSIEKVDALTAELKADGYEVISGPRTTGDGYYESCIVAVEDNQIEITV